MMYTLGLSIGRLAGKLVAAVLPSLYDLDTNPNQINRRSTANAFAFITTRGNDFAGSPQYTMVDDAGGKFSIGLWDGIVRCALDLRPTALVYNTRSSTTTFVAGTSHSTNALSVTVGRLVVVGFIWDDEASLPSSYSDNLGNTWVLAGSATSDANKRNVVAYSSIITTGGSMVFTATWGTAVNYVARTAIELSGGAALSATPTSVSGTTTAQGAATSMSLTNVNAYVRDHLVFFGGSYNSGNDGNWTPPTGMTERYDASLQTVAELSSPAKYTNGTFNASWTVSATNCGLLMVFPATPLIPLDPIDIIVRGTAGAETADETFTINVVN